MIQNAVPHWLPSREIAWFASKDLVHWSSEIALAPDTEDPRVIEYYDEPMDMKPFFSDSVVFSLLTWIHAGRTSADGGPTLQRTAEYPYIWPWARKGTVDMRTDPAHPFREMDSAKGSIRARHHAVVKTPVRRLRYLSG
jgi:hypothetical protein